MRRAMPWLVARFLGAGSVSAEVCRMPVSYRGAATVAPHTRIRLVTGLDAPTHLREHHHRIRSGIASRLGYFWNSPTLDTKQGE